LEKGLRQKALARSSWKRRALGRTLFRGSSKIKGLLRAPIPWPKALGSYGLKGNLEFRIWEVGQVILGDSLLGKKF